MPLEPMTDSTIALTYRRVSTYHQERDGVSLDVQTDQCLDYIRRQPGWRLGGDFQDTLTGRTAKRKNYQGLLEEVRQLAAQGKRVVVVTAALDRMGRDLEESVSSRKELKGLGVPLHCIREGGVLQELQADIYASIAADESRRIAARVKGSRKLKRERGYRSTSRAPWGYVWGPATEKELLGGAPPSVLRPDPKTVGYVREAWARAAGGVSVRQVAAWVAGLNSEARGGRRLDFSAVLRMFKNPTYVARVDDPERKAEVPDLAALALPSGRWEPLVDDATWTAVQHRIGGHSQIPRQARGDYLLTGVLRCPKCGNRMQGRRQSRAGRYTCSVPLVGCWFSGRADLIDRATLDIIVGVLDRVTGDADVQRAAREEWARLQAPPTRPAASRVRTLERVIAKARRRQDEMLSLLADKVIDRERYRRGTDAEQADIDAAEGELSELREQAPPLMLPPFDDVLRQARSWRKVLLEGRIVDQRDVLAKLIVSVTPRRVGYGKYAVDVIWAPEWQALEALSERVA